MHTTTVNHFTDEPGLTSQHSCCRDGLNLYHWGKQIFNYPAQRPNIDRTNAHIEIGNCCKILGPSTLADNCFQRFDTVLLGDRKSIRPVKTDW